jgi:hypothetical protein
MAKQKAIVEEKLPVEQIPVVEVQETIVEELPVQELELEDVKIAEEAPAEVEEQLAPVVENTPAPVTPKASNEVGVVRIVQKTPSGFKLLLETGEIVRVKKSQYTKGQSTIVL